MINTKLITKEIFDEIDNLQRIKKYTLREISKHLMDKHNIKYSHVQVGNLLKFGIKEQKEIRRVERPEVAMDLESCNKELVAIKEHFWNLIAEAENTSDLDRMARYLDKYRYYMELSYKILGKDISGNANNRSDIDFQEMVNKYGLFKKEPENTSTPMIDDILNK